MTVEEPDLGMDDQDQELFAIPITEMFEKSADEGESPRRMIKGFASTEAMDHDKEVVLQKGIDFKSLKNEGYINYDHQRRRIGGAVVPMIIGYPVEVVMKSGGLWVEGELFNGNPMESEQMRLANEMWSLGRELQKSGKRQLAYSIEGSVVERRGKKIVKSIARHVALTHKPVNNTCGVEMFAKSMCCGRCSPDSDNYNPGHPCQNKMVDINKGLPELLASLEKAASTETHGPMLLENLDQRLTSVLYGPEKCDCYDRTSGAFMKGVMGAYDHLTKCRKQGTDESRMFLTNLVKGSLNNGNLASLVKAACIIKQ